MLAKLLPYLQTGVRQIVPPVVATVIAAVLIAGYNRAFSGHLMQPRMAAVTGKIGMPDETPPAPAAVKPRELTDATPIFEPVVPERIFAKDNEREAGKDQTSVKVATAPAEAPVAPAPVAPARVATAPTAAPITLPPAPPVTRVTRRPEPRAIEQRPIEPYLVPPPVVVAQPPVIVAAPIAPQPMMQHPVAQEPPAVIAGKPMVTVPDRQRPPYAPYEAQRPAQQEIVAPPPPQGGPLERFVDNFKPSTIFARMRELGDKIEAAGNDILPNVRPQ